MKQIELRYHTLNGKEIAFHTATEFLVQVGKGSKGSYKTQYVVIGDLSQAVSYYNSIVVGWGEKKRLLFPNAARNPVLARMLVKDY